MDPHLNLNLMIFDLYAVVSNFSVSDLNKVYEYVGLHINEGNQPSMTLNDFRMHRNCHPQ